MRLILSILLLLLLPCWAQGEGLPLLTNYSSETYKGHPQNWAGAQAPNGLLYFGNGSGVLEYDGVRWRLIPVSNGTVVRSLDIDARGTVYVGAKNELGYLQAGQNGQLQYTSLVDRIPERLRSFADVWKVHALESEVIFQTASRIFRWNGSSFAVTEAGNDADSFHRSFKLGSRVYLSQPSSGLVEWTSDRVVKLKGGEQLAGTRIFSVLPFKKGGLLVATREKGLFVYDGELMRPFAPEASAALVERQVYNGVELPDGYAYATLRGGVLILDSEGRIRQIVDSGSGLQDDSAKNLFLDRHGSLWVALNTGIDRVEVSAPFTFYDKRSGLKGYAKDVVRHRGSLYTATLAGVFRKQNELFEPVPEINSQAWDLYSDDELLMACTSEGLYQVDGLKAFKVDSSGVYFTLIRSRIDPSRFYGGYSRGVVMLRRVGAAWRVEGRLEGIHSEVRTIAEVSDGSLWICTSADGIYLAVPAATSYTLTSYTTAHGLPGNTGNSVHMLNDNVYFGTRKGVYRFDAGRFVPDSLNSVHFSLIMDEIFSVTSDGSGGLVVVKEGSIPSVQSSQEAMKTATVGYIGMFEGKRLWEDRPFRLLRQEDIISAYFEDPQTIWLCGKNGLIRYSLQAQMQLKRDFSLLVRRVNTGGIVYDGSVQLSEIDYGRKRIRVECAALSYLREQETLYSYHLDGWDEGWSDWTTEPYRDYDLREGFYTLRVRAQDIFDNKVESSYSFRVLPPWYRTLWAYVAYALSLGLSFYWINRWRLRSLMRRNEQLEQLVRERTAEVVAQKEEVSRQKEEVERKVAELMASQREANRIFSALAEALPGTVLDGKYLLEEKIGKGGFGAVFRGRQTALNRPVAVKVFRPSSGNDSPEAVERFRREGVAACRVNHPNAVTIIDSGISSDGIAYLVMELLIGRPLSEELKLKDKFSLERCREILLPVCDALERAHSQGLVHRDIKPDNIFLHMQNGVEIVKVVDFGIAKLIGSTGPELTATGGVIGTPDYIAPERVEGRPYDGRSDVYSLGIVLFRMLTGCLPFQATESSPIATMMSRLTKDPPAPSSLNPAVPQEIDRVVLHALARNPLERPTAKEFARLLSSSIDALPIEVRRQVNPAPTVPASFHSSGETETIDPTGTSTRILPN